MKITPPPFVKAVGDIWTLAGDKWTTPCVERAKSLAWDPSFETCVKGLAGRSGLMVDAGAFIGDSTAWFAEHCELLTFEPQRDAYICLCHNLPKGTHWPVPLGNGELVGLQFGEGGNMGARRSMKEGEMVRTLRLDDLRLDNVVFLKLDVEGWEPNVLDGARETLSRCRPLVRVEYNKAALDRAGFVYRDIERHFAGWSWIEVFRCGQEQWDVLYFPTNL